MEKEELRKQFIISDDEVRLRLGELVSKAAKHCRVDKRGRIHFEKNKLSSKDKIKLVLAARAIAAELESNISPDITVEEIALSTGLPANQVRARCTEIVTEHFAESPSRGQFRAVGGRIERLLDSLN